MRPLLLLVLSLSFGGNKKLPTETVGYVYIQEVILKCKNYADCEVRMAEAAGTATRIIWNDEFYWLSAGHVCESVASSDEISASRSMKINVLGENRDRAQEVRLTVYKNDHETDLCLMQASPGPARKISSRRPNPGERISTFAFPDGVYYEGMFPLYEGTYNGNESSFHCLASIPVSPGSSGAGVIDEKGDLIGVISSVSITFNHRTIYSCESATKWFVSIASEMLKEKAASIEKNK